MRSWRLPKTPVSKRLGRGVPVGKLGLMRGRIRTRSLASSSPNAKRAPGALFGNATLYVETPAGGIKPVSGAPDDDHPPARGLIGAVAAHASAVGRGHADDCTGYGLDSLCDRGRSRPRCSRRRPDPPGITAEN